MNSFKRTSLLLVVSLLCLLAAGCDSGGKNNGDPDDPSYKTVEIEGHDYMAFQTAYGYWNYTYKGNCKNH